jgi:hypothetical protein
MVYIDKKYTMLIGFTIVYKLWQWKIKVTDIYCPKYVWYFLYLGVCPDFLDDNKAPAVDGDILSDIF